MRGISLTFVLLAGTVLGACSKPSAATCSQNSDCPSDAICVTGICQKGVPSGGASSSVGGSATVTAGTMTMDVIVGQPATPVGAAGNRNTRPAENTR